jgi:hypothetical protein
MVGMPRTLGNASDPHGDDALAAAVAQRAGGAQHREGRRRRDAGPAAGDVAVR